MVLAAAMAWATSLPRYWVPMLPPSAPAAVLALLELPLLLWLAAGLLPWLVFRGVVADRVPLFLSDRPATRALLGCIPDDRPVSVVDLGCGTAGCCWPCARRAASPACAGSERAPHRLVARLRPRMCGRGHLMARSGTNRCAPRCGLRLPVCCHAASLAEGAARDEAWQPAGQQQLRGPGRGPATAPPLDGSGMATALYVLEMGRVAATAASGDQTSRLATGA
jgi:hypothetical protein